MVPRTVLHYQLGEKIGVGGMGEVYRARDTRLNRVVAIKALSPAMSANPDRRRRFVQEAQTVSALNHPNIITIFDIVDDGETQYMVVEYVDGKTLLELISPTGMPLEEAVKYATQISEALCAAHSAGVVHRDLKPANVMVTGSGLVKVLDFGLAKMIDWAPTDSNAATVTMQSSPLTVEGTLLGTVNYMSPEQAEGRKLDARSDIFSFGALLYEMLTGHHAFRGDSVIATLTAVLRDDIQPLRALRPEVPVELERIVDACLKKNPDERTQSMGDIHAALSALKQQQDSGARNNLRPMASAATRAPTGRRLGFVFTALSVLVLAAGAGYWWMNGHHAAPQTSRTQPPVSAAAAPSAGAMSVTQPVTAPPPEPAPSTNVPVILDDGLLVRLLLAEDIPSGAMEGDPVRFTVAADVRVEGAVVVRQGATAVGAIVDSPKKKLIGLVPGGKMTFRFDRVDAVDGQKVPIRATHVAHGEPSKRPVDAGGKKSKDVAATEGTAYSAYVDGTKTVTAKK